MHHASRPKLLLRLSFLAGSILLLLPNLFGWLDEELIRTIEGFVGYGMLLSLLSILLLVIAYQRLSYHLTNRDNSSAKASTEQSQADETDEEALRKSFEKHLHQLSPDEKALLKQFIDGNTKTKRLDLTHSTAMGLASRGILYRPVPQVTAYGLVTYALQHWAWEYLKKNSNLLD
jgi:hypothetical protein